MSGFAGPPDASAHPRKRCAGAVSVSFDAKMKHSVPRTALDAVLAIRSSSLKILPQDFGSKVLRNFHPTTSVVLLGGAHRWESDVDRQTKREIIIVTIASLAPIPLITAAVVSILY